MNLFLKMQNNPFDKIEHNLQTPRFFRQYLNPMQGSLQILSTNQVFFDFPSNFSLSSNQISTQQLHYNLVQINSSIDSQIDSIYLRYNIMNERAGIQQYSNGKPVNINISFNISRKQVMQNINPIDQDNTFNFKDEVTEECMTSTKPKTGNYRPLKTPELAQTDRHIYNKDLEFARATQELKRKKKRKRSSGDYTADKSSNFPFYPVDLDKSLPSHKRGYTTTVMKKTTSGTKHKKQPIKIQQYLKQGNTIPISALIGQEKKGEGKSVKIEKNLKNILTKLINNEQSKRSLPLPSVPSKSKYNQSTSLTSRKMSTTKTGKKRHSKSHMMVKERGANHVLDHVNSSVSQIQAFQNPAIFQKLSNFKSNQNSILISEIDNMEENERMSPRQKSQSQNKIVIKTDQSIECIDEIHNWERDFYKETFFEEKGNGKHENNNGFFRKQKQGKESSPDGSDTLLLIETYVKLLNAPDVEQVLVEEEFDSRRNDDSRKFDRNVNERVDIYDGNNYMNMNDFEQMENLIGSGRSNANQQKKDNREEQKESKKGKRSEVERMFDDFEEDEQEIVYSTARPMWKRESQESELSSIGTKNQQLKQKIDIKRVESREQPDHNYEIQQNHFKVIPSSYQPHPKQQDSTHFRPFISSQMGRQQHNRQNTTSSQQRQRLNELKKHQIQKWSNLLEYIKSNMNSETNTQEVLEQVYEYLSRAKVDLIKEGRNISQGVSEVTVSLKNKERLEEEFTNKLSSQLERSQGKNKRQESRQLNEFERKNNQQKDDKQSQQNSRQKTEQEEILDQQARSFKEDYESSQQQESIKFMNLSTIETALKNRFNQLTHKKDKDLQKLQLLVQEKKLTEQQYVEQKQYIEKEFKRETNEILTVKKNIWKGYNQAKGILDKSYINSRIEQEFKGQLYSSKFSSDKSSRKDRKMMKCLSQSYLNKKKIDYKKFIEDEEKKREEEQEEYGMKRQRGESNYEEQDDQEEEENNSNGHEGYEQRHYNERSDEQQVSDYRGKYSNSEQSNSRLQSSQYSESLVENTQNLAKHNSVDDEFEKISRKLNKLKEQHETAIAQEKTKNNNHNNKPKQQHSLSSSSREEEHEENLSNNNQRFNENHINEFDAHLVEDKSYSKQSNSPMIDSMSPEPSVHYEEVEKEFGQDESNESGKDEEDEGDFVEENENLGEVKHSSSEDQDRDEEEYEEDYEPQQEKEEKAYKDLDKDSDYSDQEEKIIARQLSEVSKFSPLSSSKGSQPLKNSLHQLKESQQLEQPKPSSKSPSSKHSSSSKVSQKQQNQLSPSTQALYRKLKYLKEQDRQDIFEFMFLDLCIELYQQPCHQNKLMNAVNRYVSKQYQLSKRKKGVKTNLNVVKDYLKRFCGYLIRTSKHVLQNVNVPMGPTAIQMLKYMHENEDFEQEPAQGEGVVTLIVPVSVFDAFERSLLPTLEFEKYYDNQEKQLQRVNFLKNILHIHNKALFDALNEFLDHQRPFGIWGKPFPWKKSSSFTHAFTQQQQEERLKKSAQKVVQACSYVCGLLVDKEESLVGNAKISEGYIEQIREDRISRMLANEMIENEERWVFYDDEETEVLVETSNFVYNMLLRETLEDMMRFKKESGRNDE